MLRYPDIFLEIIGCFFMTKPMFWNVRRRVREMIPGGVFQRPSFLFGKSGKEDVSVSVGLLFFGAFLSGILIKLLLSFFITIGYDDYRLMSDSRGISLIELQAKVLGEGGSLTYTPERGAGPVCVDSK